MQRTAGGTTFEGEWTDDALAGQVVVLEGALFTSNADGRVVGEVGDDGIVRLSHTFGNGDVYHGGWEGGGPHGEGSMTYAAGGRYDRASPP